MQGESERGQDRWRGELLSTWTRISVDSPFLQRRTWGLHKRGAPLQGASALISRRMLPMSSCARRLPGSLSHPQELVVLWR